MKKLAIIILNKSNNNLLFKCLNSIKNKTKYLNYHVYIGDTGSSKEELDEIISFLRDNFSNTKNVKLINYNYYNFAKTNNNLVLKHLNNEDVYLFCNNDIELIDDCITPVMDMFNKDKNESIGTVGVKLLFADETIQHAGQLLFLNSDGTFKHVTHRGLRESKEKYSSQENVIGNTGGFMFTSRKSFDSIGGFNENYIECLEDVEYNLEVLLLGKQNIYRGDLSSFHFESQTRNKNPKQLENFILDANFRLIPFVNKNVKNIINNKSDILS